jgi:lipid-A-disaccharide synthase
MNPGAGCVLISCGEPSGEIYAADVAEHIAREAPELRRVGVGGSLLRAQVHELWADLDELSVMGFAEVVRHLPRLRRLRERIANRAAAERVRLLLAVDYPGFHTSLAGAMKRRGIQTLHYIPPKTWSWGGWRNRQLRKNVARCAVIFPFEEAYYAARGIDAEFVGHPLVDRYREILSEPQEQREGLLLVPGSRPQEISRIGPAMAEAAALLRAEGAVEKIRLSRAQSVPFELLRPMLALCRDVQVVEGPLIQHLRRSAAAIVCSGTASVETALSRTPHAIVYRTSHFTYAVARWLATVDAIGMANIVLGRRAFPEFLQRRLEPKALAKAMRPLLLPASPELVRQRSAFEELMRNLGQKDQAARNVARMALAMLDDHRTRNRESRLS